MSSTENEHADGFRQVEEQCRVLAERASWIVEALPRPRPGAVGTENKLRQACQYVDGILTELRDVVHRVRGLDADLVAVRATAAERDAAAASAAGKVEEAEKRIAAAEASVEKHAQLTSVLKAERAEVQTSKRELATMLEAARKETDALARKRSELDKSLTAAREMEKAAETVEKQKAQAEKDVTLLREDVARLEKVKENMQNGLIDDWQRLEAERRTLEKDVANYNKAASEYSRLKAEATKDLQDEKARVGRRDERIARLQMDVQTCQSSMLELKSKYDEEVKNVRERDLVIAEMKLNQERTVAQATLSQASVEVDNVHRQVSSEYRGLVQKFDELKISQDQLNRSHGQKLDEMKLSQDQKLDEMTVSQNQTLKTLQADMKNIEDVKAAMVSTTKNMAEGIAASNNLKTDLSPNVRAFKQTVEQIEVMRRQMQKMEEAHSARQRDEAARARKHMVELIHEIDLQTREQHQQELADLCRRHEAQLRELRKTTGEELTGVRQRHVEQLTELQKKREELADARQQHQAQLSELRKTREELAGVRQQHEAQLTGLHITTEEELADARQRYEAQQTELRRTRDELAGVRQRYEKDIEVAQKEAEESKVQVVELRRQLERARDPSVSPDRRRKKPRADDSRPNLQTPPSSAFRVDGAVGTDVAKWQSAVRADSEVWGSFEPRLIDPMGDLTYDMLLRQLHKAVRGESARSRFMAFVDSDATGWHCVERVADLGSESAVGPEPGKCTLRRHQKAGECLQMKRVGGRKIDFQVMRIR